MEGARGWEEAERLLGDMEGRGSFKLKAAGTGQAPYKAGLTILHCEDYIESSVIKQTSASEKQRKEG